MSNQLKKLEIKGFSQLSRAKLKEVKRFVSHCKRLEGYEPVFYWGSIERRKNPGVNEILCYNQEKKLIGLLSLYHFEEEEVEVTAFIHSDYRDELIYKGLWETFKSVIAKVPFNLKRYVFTCNQENVGLKEYLARLGATCNRYTHKLGLTKGEYLKKTPKLKNHIIFKHELDSEAPAIFALIEDEIVGSVNVQFEKDKSYLYDLSLETGHEPEFNHFVLMGFLEVLFKEWNVKKVLLDVQESFELNLYKKLGFKTLKTYEHWSLPVFVDPLKQREKQLEELILNFQCYQVQDQLSQVDYKH